MGLGLLLCMWIHYDPLVMVAGVMIAEHATVSGELDEGAGMGDLQQ